MGAISGKGLYPITNPREIEEQANKIHGDAKNASFRCILEQIGNAAYDIYVGKSTKRVVNVPEEIFLKFSF
jgi:hypothetical protein